ncbi:MAG: NADPH-dependent FMN reductase, partial [Alphaproteobacteria bacterium]|nr:NADPH-dependent FMN reductase [Alphaproteobacteria bacterium]
STGGRTGGEVAQFTLRQALTTFNANLLQGSAMVVPGLEKAFDANHRLQSQAQQESLARLMTRLRAAV